MLVIVLGCLGLFALGFLLLKVFGRKGSSLKTSASSGNLKKGVSAANLKKLDGASPDSIPEGATRVTVLYGTQTGTAERFSKALASEFKDRYGAAAHVDVVDIENYNGPASLPKETLVFLVMATYGDGEPTDNAAKFYDYLLKSAVAAEAEGTTPFSSVSFGVFGLGNKQYEHFNAVGKKADKAMSALGARQVVRRGDGDDDGDIEDDFAQWKNELWPGLEKAGLFKAVVGGATAVNGSAATHVLAYDVEVFAKTANVEETDAWVSGTSTGHAPDAHNPRLARVIDVRELHTQLSDRSCVHVEIDITGTDVRYETGDHVGIYCENAPGVVQAAGAALGWDLDQLVSFRVPSGNADNLSAPPPGPLRLRTALARYADLLGVPKKSSLLALAEFASEDKDRSRLRFLASPDGRQEFQDHVAKPMRSLLEILLEVPSARPPPGAFFGGIAPRLQPRYYSISSSSTRHPTAIHVTCSVVSVPSATGRLHEGVCSNWLKRIQPGARLPVFVRHSGFRLPKDASKPTLMIGPGTGLAPFRGFLQEREELARKGAKLGEARLYFGCRDRKLDFIYERELRAFEDAGVCSLSVAFSREKSAKEYVQHHLARDRAAVYDMLETRGAHVYVCGDAKHMAKDVHHALVEAVREGRGCTGTQAEGYVQALHDAGRYQRDVW